MDRGGLILFPRAERQRRSTRSRDVQVNVFEDRAGLRPAFPENVPALVALKTAVVDETFTGFSTDALSRWKSRFCSARYFQQRLSDPEKRTWFYFVGPALRPAAMAALKVREGIAYVADFYVRERGQGTGTAMLLDVLDLARGEGLTVAAADVFSMNPQVIGWLENHGFRVVSEYDESSLGVRVMRMHRSL